MSRKCEICGKGPMFGNNVSHAHNITKKVQNPNVQKIRVKQPSGAVKSQNVCMSCLRSGKVVKG